MLSRARVAIRSMWDAWSSYGTPSGNLMAWDASKAGSRLSKWVPPSGNFASAYIQPALLRSRSRDAYRNIAWARRAVDILTAYVVGVGIKPLLVTPDAGLKALVQSSWTRWTDSADVEQRHDFYGLQAAAFRAALIDGESLIQILPGEPLRLKLLAAEHLDSSRDNATNIAGGIQFGPDDERVAYWLLPKHPAQPVITVSVPVPAELVVHLFAPLQPGAQRGASWLAPALLPMYELREFVETGLVTAKVASLFAGFLRSQDGSPLVADSGEPTFEPGSIARLRPGDEISFSNPANPDRAYEPFVKSQLRSIAAAWNLPYELLSGDLSATTFASGRLGLLAFRRYCDSIVHNLLVFSLCRPVWQWWVRIAVAMGELPETVLDLPVKWVAQPVEMLDSRMEVETQVRQVRAGFTSRSEIVSQSGLDSEVLDEEIRRDNERADRLGLIFDSDPRKVSQQGQEQSQPQEVPSASSSAGE
jgi:lambda family phage portal protein